MRHCILESGAGFLAEKDMDDEDGLNASEQSSMI